MMKPIRAIVVGLATALIAAAAGAAPAAAAIPVPGAALKWKNLDTQFCLGSSGGETTSGTAIIVWPCNGSSDQRWTVETFPGAGAGEFVVRNGKNRNMCLSVAADSIEDGAALVLWSCKVASFNRDQRWMFRDGTISSCTVFLNVHSLKVMGVRAGSRDPGTPVIQWHYTAENNQQWCGEAA